MHYFASLQLFSTVLIAFQADKSAVLADENIFAPNDNATYIIGTDTLSNTTNTSSAKDIEPSSSTFAADVIMSSKPSDLAKMCGVDGHVDCDHGLVRDGDGTTCEVACDGKCCGGPDACDDFTGIVCKDGSCSSTSGACQSANIPLVMNSCKDGYQVCLEAGNLGTVGSIVNSCVGEAACMFLGRSGEVGSVTDSCIGKSACDTAGYDGGYVGDIFGSCNFGYSCTQLGSVGEVGNVMNSCNGQTACHSVGYGLGGVIGKIAKSCNNAYACTSIGYNGGKAGDLNDSCNEGNSCYDVAWGSEGSIGSITKSCNAFNACHFAGGERGDGPILSDLKRCCNIENGCVSINESTLPVECLSHASSRSSKKGPSAVDAPLEEP